MSFGTFVSFIMVYFPSRRRLFSRVLFIFIGTLLTVVCYHIVVPREREQQNSTEFFFSLLPNLDEPKVQVNKDQSIVLNTAINAQNTNSISTNEEKETGWKLDIKNIPQLSAILGRNIKRLKTNCAKFPDLYTMHFSNVYWQVQGTGSEIYYFNSAYLDMRGKESTYPYHPYDSAVVRVLSMSDEVDINEKNSSLKICQFWFENKLQPKFGNITQIRMMWSHSWGGRDRVQYFPYLISCQMPQGLKELPLSVSLVPARCTNATNNLNILHRDRADSPFKRIPKKEVGVCVKTLDFPNAKMHDRLIEWIETLRLMGADKIFFYEFFVNSKIKKVLDYYESQGIIEVTQTSLPGGLPNHSQLRHLFLGGEWKQGKINKRTTELIPYNDCFYKNMYDYKYIAILDIDEIIVPTEEINWSDLLQLINDVDVGVENFFKRPVTNYCFQNFYYLDDMLKGKETEVADIPTNFHMLQHVYRARNSTFEYDMKCFHSTDAILGVHNHFAFFCRAGIPCRHHRVAVNRAQMNHYRSSCRAEMKNCTSFVLDTKKDTKLWRHKDEIIKRVQMVLRLIN